MSTTATVQTTVAAMINEIGMLRKLVPIDNMPVKLQKVRELLRELDAELAAEMYRSIKAE